MAIHKLEWGSESFEIHDTGSGDLRIPRGNSITLVPRIAEIILRPRPRGASGYLGTSYTFDQYPPTRIPRTHSPGEILSTPDASFLGMYQPYHLMAK